MYLGTFVVPMYPFKGRRSLLRTNDYKVVSNICADILNCFRFISRYIQTHTEEHVCIHYAWVSIILGPLFPLSFLRISQQEPKIKANTDSSLCSRSVALRRVRLRATILRSAVAPSIWMCILVLELLFQSNWKL